MKSPDGQTHVVMGEFQEIIPDEKLVYTWQWEQPNSHKTLVTVVLKELTLNKTELSLTHQNFVNEADKQNHNQGWVGCLDRLERLLDR